MLIWSTNSNVHLSATSLITYCTYWIISANYDFHLIHEILYPRILIKPRSECLICTIDSIILLHDQLCTLYFIILIFVNKLRESSNKYLIFTAYLYTCILACLPDNQRMTPPPLFFLFNIHMHSMFHCVDVDITYNCTCWSMFMNKHCRNTMENEKLFILNVIIWYTITNFFVFSFLLFELIELFYHWTPVRLVCFRIILMNTWYQHFLSPFSMHISLNRLPNESKHMTSQLNRIWKRAIIL